MTPALEALEKLVEASHFTAESIVEIPSKFPREHYEPGEARRFYELCHNFASQHAPALIERVRLMQSALIKCREEIDYWHPDKNGEVRHRDWEKCMELIDAALADAPERDGGANV